MDDVELQEKKRRAQGLLAQAQWCLDEAAKVAEEGGFSISFHGGGTYVPSAVFGPSLERRLRAEKMAKADHEEVWDEMSQEARDQYTDDYEEDLKHEDIPYDYCDEAGWWMPSRNC